MLKNFILCTSVLLLASPASHGAYHEPKTAKSKVARITTQAWRGGENAQLSVWSVDGEVVEGGGDQLGYKTVTTFSGTPDGRWRVRVEPRQHEIGIQYDPEIVYEMDRPDRRVQGALQAKPLFRSISFEPQAPRVYIVKARTWVRATEGFPDTRYQLIYRWPGPIISIVTERCDVVWVADKKSRERVACRAFPEGCMSCDVLNGLD